MDTLVGDKVLTPEGKNWLIEALDPFHDTAIQLAGFPDTNRSASIIQCVKYSQNIKAASSITADTPWDCQIVMWPLPHQHSPGNDQGVNCTSNGGNFGPGVVRLRDNSGDIKPFPIGGVTAYQVDAGGEMFGAAETSANTTSLTISVEDNYLAGCGRIVGMGFEVVNTTAPLYRSGQALPYRMPVPSPDDQVTLLAIRAAETLEAKEKRKKADPDPMVATTEAMGWMSCWQTSMPPRNLGEATKLSGSKPWKAEDGCYVPAVMNTTLNPAKTQKPVLAIAWANDLGGASDSAVPYAQEGRSTGVHEISSAVIVGPRDGPGTGDIKFHFPDPTFVAPFNIAGVYLTGLDHNTTLQVNAIYFIERFPTPYEDDLVVLASPSPGFDPAALEIYQRALKQLPVGVMQGENPLGEWFRGVLDSVAKVASPLGKAMSILPVVGPAAGMIGQVADEYNKIRKPKKKAANKKRKAAALPKVKNRVGAQVIPPPGMVPDAGRV